MRPTETDYHDVAQHREHFAHFIKQVSPAADPLSVMLFGLVMYTNNQLVQVAERNLEGSGLTWAKFRLLMNLGRAEKHSPAGGLLPSELSELQGITRNTASSLLASLVKEGLVTREAHLTDRRKFIIRLTPKGRGVLKARLDSQFQCVSHCFDTLSKVEREELANALTRVHEHLRQLDKR